jgi:hypothetical protein
MALSYVMVGWGQSSMHAAYPWSGCTGYVRRVTHDEIADTIG